MAGAVVLGAGPGTGRAIANRFARGGMPVTVVARSRATVDAVAGSVAASGVDVLALTADVADEAALRGALTAAEERFGLPDVVVYNAALIRPDEPGELAAAGQLAAWSVNVVGALTAAAQVLPRMAARGSGTFLVTGGMPEPKPGYVSLSLGKAGVRTLAALLDTQYRDAGVHVATVTVAGPVAPGTAWDPDEIAEHYWRLHHQPREVWTHEAVH
ncbi:SDR family NAD(P)-dependent oxidoreductase [Pseudonocardia sp. DSM 110487]|uniref:SDR family NAD(P)-dependent oxidoreductase n=1 Tax=Pseudonocardia sp. DSM 110487 TaxID=2865833 RepID=UPI001C699FEE|nr:SDR family NAD(P)-dependent oxidoreductase [Pseudonocardia sp. DSM 110487]QYN31850.1 SDR family NAD(P)-dependent oxidoreductase [Pseudonocardia sp. DSM 110487]